MSLRTAYLAFLLGFAMVFADGMTPARAQSRRPVSLEAAIDSIAQHMLSDYPLQAPRNNLAVMQFLPASGAPRRLGESLMQKIRIRMFDLDPAHRLNFVAQGKVTDLIVNQGADSLREIYDGKRRIELGKLLSADHFIYGTYELAQDGSAEIVSYLVEIESGLIRAQRVERTEGLPEGLLLPVRSGSAEAGTPSVRTYRVSGGSLRSVPDAAKKYQMATLFEQRGRKDRSDALYAEIVAEFPDSLEAMHVQARGMTEDVVRLTAERRYDESLLNAIRAIPAGYVSNPQYETLHGKTIEWLTVLGNRELENNRTEEGKAFYEKAVAMGLPRSSYEAYLERVKNSGQSKRAEEIRAMMKKGDRDGAEVKIVEWEADSPANLTVKQLKKEFDRPEGMATIPGGTVLGRDVDPYNLDVYETTNKEFLEFVRVNAKYRKGSVTDKQADADYLRHWSNPLQFPEELGNRAVTFVSQPVADAYCHWRKKRLPTSDEWGLAAGEGRRKYPWGDKEPTPDMANYGTLMGGPLPGDSHPQGRTPEGIYHMAGNVWEVTSTVEGINAVSRGGCYFDTPEYLASNYRGSRTKDAVVYTSRYMGFRCAQ
jgi:hypothetical protein